MSCYLAAYQAPKGAGDARPTALDIVRDQDLTGKLPNRVFLVTGVSNGIGIETLRALYATGAHVFGTVRDLKKGQKVVDQITAERTGGKITLLEMDSRSLKSVRQAASRFLETSQTLHVLVNNAGVVNQDEGKTEDGFELHFQVNHLAHFYLFQLLKPTLLASSTPENPSRVVCVSSTGHRFSRINFDDYNFTNESYDRWLAYGRSKTANILMSNEIERRYGDSGLHSTSLHPGLIPPQGVELKAEWSDPVMIANMMTPKQGAATTIYAALSREWQHKGGKFLSACIEQGPTQHPGNPMCIGDDGYEAWAYDEEAACRLWTDCLRFLELQSA